MNQLSLKDLPRFKNNNGNNKFRYELTLACWSVSPNPPGYLRSSTGRWNSWVTLKTRQRKSKERKTGREGKKEAKEEKEEGRKGKKERKGERTKEGKKEGN